LQEALFGSLTGHKIESHPLNRIGNALGVVVGGNLTLINNIIGTASEIITLGKILFIEDVGEQLYHLDRLMVQLRRAGKLAHLSGLIVGQFHDMRDSAVPFGASVEEIILNAVVGYDYPVCFNFPAGHVEDNRAFYLGRRSKLSVQTDCVSLDFV
jgi:muramoyltetrapeptide carboxypeptidase